MLAVQVFAHTQWFPPLALPDTHRLQLHTALTAAVICRHDCCSGQAAASSSLLPPRHVPPACCTLKNGNTAAWQAGTGSVHNTAPQPARKATLTTGTTKNICNCAAHWHASSKQGA